MVVLSRFPRLVTISWTASRTFGETRKTKGSTFEAMVLATKMALAKHRQAAKGASLVQTARYHVVSSGVESVIRGNFTVAMLWAMKALS